MKLSSTKLEHVGEESQQVDPVACRPLEVEDVLPVADVDDVQPDVRSDAVQEGDAVRDG